MTLREVAHELGVSAKTVSNAYSRPDQLSADLRERVLAAAGRLGYAGPDPLAAGLRRGWVGAVGFAYANPLPYAFEDPVSVQLLAGITSVTEQAGTGLLLAAGSGLREDGGTLATALIDGLVVASLGEDDPALRAAVARHLPMVVIDQPDPGTVRLADGSPAPWVGIDDRAAAALAAQHLLDLGHRRLGVVSFGLGRPPQRRLEAPAAQASTTYAVTRRRLAGYQDAATDAGLDWDQVPVMTTTDNTVDEGTAVATALLSARPRPTALLCLSDRLAEGALRAAHHAGLAVPTDLSVIGFDDAPSAAALRLTTIAQPHHHKGHAAATALLDVLADRRPTTAVDVLPTALITRDTTTRCPVRKPRASTRPDPADGHPDSPLDDRAGRSRPPPGRT